MNSRCLGWLAAVAVLAGAGLTLRAEEAAKGPAEGQAWTVPEVGMEFVWIAALKCWVGKYETTNGEYRKFQFDHDSVEVNGHRFKGDRQPVVLVNFDDANVYAAWLTKRERQAGRLPARGLHYRLPTKDEWMTFAQCGDDRTYPWGNNWPPKYGNYADRTAKGAFTDWTVIAGYDDGFAVTCPVEKSGKNDWDLYGVGGNVWECTAARPDGEFDAWRGASWVYYGRVILRCDYRIACLASNRTYYNGFRLVLSR